MDTIKFGHTSVLLYETVGSLNIIPGGCYVDGTLGGAGHAFEVCKRLGNGRADRHRSGWGCHCGGFGETGSISG